MTRIVGRWTLVHALADLIRKASQERANPFEDFVVHTLVNPSDLRVMFGKRTWRITVEEVTQ